MESGHVRSTTVTGNVSGSPFAHGAHGLSRCGVTWMLKRRKRRPPIGYGRNRYFVFAECILCPSYMVRRHGPFDHAFKVPTRNKVAVVVQLCLSYALCSATNDHVSPTAIDIGSTMSYDCSSLRRRPSDSRYRNPPCYPSPHRESHILGERTLDRDLHYVPEWPYLNLNMTN